MQLAECYAVCIMQIASGPYVLEARAVLVSTQALDGI